MKRIIKWGAIFIVVLVVAVGAIYYFYINSIVKTVVETQGSKQMNLKTELDGARVAIFGGEVGLDDLKIANPPGFTAPHLFTLDKIDVEAPLKQLRGNPKRVAKITLNKPKLVIERSGDNKFNFKAAIDQMPKSPTPTGPQEPGAPAGEEMKMIIDELMIKEAIVVIRPGINLPGIAQEISVPIPTVVMKNIGNADGTQNGAAMRDVAQQVITVLAGNASNSNLLPDQLKGLINLDVNAIVAELGTRFGSEMQKRLAAAVPGALGEQLGKIISDPNILKDPSKAGDALKENLGKTLGENIPTSNPSEVLKDPGKAAEGLKDLFGGKKDKKKD
jgi:hypothetical protein